jgi:hypothetical protein
MLVKPPQGLNAQRASSGSSIHRGPIVRHRIREREDKNTVERISRDIPDDDRLVIRPRDKEIGVRVEVDAKDITTVAL